VSETEVQSQDQFTLPSLKLLSPGLVSRAVLLAVVLGILATVPGLVALFVSDRALTVSELFSQVPERLFAGSAIVSIGVAVGLALGFLWPLFSTLTKKFPELNTQLNQWLAPIIKEKINESPLRDLELDIKSLEDRFTDRLQSLIENLFSDERAQALADGLIRRAMEGLRQQLADTIMTRFIQWLEENNERRINALLLEQFLRDTVSSAIVEKLASMISAWRKRLVISWVTLVFTPVPFLWIPAADDTDVKKTVSEIKKVSVVPADGECIRLKPTKKPERSFHLPHANLITIGDPQLLRARLTSAITYSLHQQGLADFISPPCFMRPHTERRSGVEMGLWHVEYYTTNRHYAHVHYTAQSDFIKALFSGELKADGVVLTMSAREGVTEVVREQLQLIRRVGFDSLVVFIDDVDGSTDLTSLEMQLQSYLTDLGFAEVPLIQGDTVKILEGDQGALGAAAMQKLLAAIDSTVPTPQRRKDKPFLMPVEDVFTIKDAGTVATGIVEQGIVKCGDSIEIVGMGPTRTATVTGVQMFRKLLDEAHAGDNVGVVFADLSRKDLKRGHVLATPGSIVSGSYFEAVLYLLPSEDGGRTEAIYTGYRPQIYMRTTDITGTITLSTHQDTLQPGEHTLVTVRLAVPMALRTGLPFVVRQGGQTVGTGIITAILKE
jgi:elongation factor Tu